MVTAIIADKKTGRRIRLRFWNWELARATLTAMAGGHGAPVRNILNYAKPWEVR